MALSVILVECDVTSPAGAVETLRFADRAFFPMSPTDADRPNVAWDERLIEPPSLKRVLFDDLQTLQPGLGVGVMSLANADRALDAYQGHIWGEVRVWRWIYGTPFAEARPLMTGPAGGTPSFDVQSARPGRVRVVLYDARLDLERATPAAVYAGTNNGTTILYEGDPGLKGRAKPLAYGNLLDAQIPAPLVNLEAAAYQLHDGPIAPFGAVIDMPEGVFDRGMPADLTFGVNLGSTENALFDATTPPSDQVHTQASRGLLKVNADLVGSVTFGYRGDATGGVYVETPGPILKRLLQRAGVPADRIGASVAAVDCDRVVGHFSQDEAPLRDTIGQISRAAPLSLLPDRLGVWQAVMLSPPAEVADVTLFDDQLLALEADDVDVAGSGEFRIGWGRIWTTFRREALVPELLGTDEEVRLAEAYRYATAIDAEFKTRYPGSWRKLQIETALRLDEDAEALAELIRDLFGLRSDGRPRRRWRATVEMTDAVMDIDLGATVELAAPRFGIDQRFLLIGEEPLRPRRDQTIWTLWG